MAEDFVLMILFIFMILLGGMAVTSLSQKLDGPKAWNCGCMMAALVIAGGLLVALTQY